MHKFIAERIAVGKKRHRRKESRGHDPLSDKFTSHDPVYMVHEE